MRAEGEAQVGEERRRGRIHLPQEGQLDDECLLSMCVCVCLSSAAVSPPRLHPTRTPPGYQVISPSYLPTPPHPYRPLSKSLAKTVLFPPLRLPPTFHALAPLKQGARSSGKEASSAEPLPGAYDPAGGGDLGRSGEIWGDLGRSGET